MSSQSSSTATTTTAPEPQAPLLRPRQGSSDTATTRPTTLALLLGRASGRRGPSMLVRETAARQLEERRADWGYSKPVVALDIMWNVAFVVVSVVMLLLTIDEKPNTPIRFWICGYALQCGVHVVLVWIEYRRRNPRRTASASRIRVGGDEESQQVVEVRREEGNDSEDEDENGGFAPRSRWVLVVFIFVYSLGFVFGVEFWSLGVFVCLWRLRSILKPWIS